MRLPGYFFEWPSRHHIQVALPLFLLLAFLLHALGVVVFSITYPHATTPPPRSAKVFFLQRGSAAAKPIEPMLAAEDPALFSPAEVSDHEVWHVPETGYVPSFETAPPSLASSPGVPLAPAAVVAPLPIASTIASAIPAASPTVVSGLPTEVKFSEALANRSFSPPKDAIFKAQIHQNLAPLEFLVEVSPSGLPLHVFQISATSGNDLLDRQAAAYLARGRFAPRDGAAQGDWGMARFLWGADVRRGKEP